MVLVVTGVGIAAVPILGTVGAGIATTATVNAVAALEGATLGATVVAMGEGALVGVGAIGGGGSAGIALATLAGPIGWAVVGFESNKNNKNNDQNDYNDRSGDSGYTWDCWKPVVMDDSVDLSHGITLRDLHNHPNIKQMIVDSNGLIAENIRGEQFHLSPVQVKGTLAFHAARI